MKIIAHGLLLFLGFSLSLLPMRLFLWKGKLWGQILFACGFRRKVVRENIRLAFPDWDEDKIEALERANYEHYGLLLLEFLRSFWRFGDFLDRHSSVEGEANLHQAFSHGKGVFVMTAHLGNWEALPSHGAWVLKVPTNMVTKRLKPDWFHELVESTRGELGTHMFYEPRTMQNVVRALRKNEIVGFAMDQFAGSPVGARVPFFGIPVGTNTVLAVLAHRYGAPVIPGFALRKPGGGFHVVFEPPILPTECTEEDTNYANLREKEIIVDTAKYTAVLESWVRRYPEQWLWIHRRWKGDLSPLPPNLVGEMMKPD